VSDFALTYIKI